MNLERLLIASAVAAATAGLFALTDVGANATRQGDGTLAQEPMHLGSTVPPNFIMAIDDSGSMTFQTMLPAKDGAACWSSESFYSGTSLRTSGSCNYHYVLPGPRAGSGYYAIPPLPQYAFARSPDVNPSYFDPDQTYTPWVKKDGTSFDQMDPESVATPVDPGDANAGTVNLFGTFEGTGSTEYFRMQNGMYVPKDVRYATYDCVNSGWGGCREYAWVWKTSNGFSWNAGATNVAFSYTPAMVYLKTATAPAGYTAVGGEIKNACGTNCSLYGYTPSSADTKRNFANWFAFYGNRNRAMIAGLTLSLNSLSTDMNVGYFTINSRDSKGNYSAVPMFDTSKSDQKQQLMEKVLDLGASGGTPNRWAVNHIGSQFDTRTDIIKYACQKNAGMLFTDGYSNTDGPNVPDPANADLGMGVPFSDSHSSTLADIAAHYYNKRLRGNALTPGQVPVGNPQICEGSDDNAKKGVDCNRDPHMNFYGVTLGARGKLFGVTYGVKPDGTTDGNLATQQVLALTNSPAWEARTNDDPNTVDELWHATMNARGQYINAQTPADITTAMRNVLASVGVGAGVSGSLAITGSRLSTGSLSVVPRFDRNGTDWYGDIDASRPKQVTDADGKVSFTYTKLWSASTKLPAAADRKLFYGTTGDGAKPTVANFYSAGPNTLAALCANYPADQCGLMQLTDVDSLGVDATQAVHYLAGDRTLEGTKLRRRTSPIGDIVNSTPVVAAGTDDYGYALIRKSDGSFEYDPYAYTAYLDAKKARKPVVFVGANDGMLHAFNGDTGVEQFGYIPAAVVGYMGNLLFPNSPDFQHRYLVDGPVVVSDALFGTTWKTVVVGTAGAGARSVFGLDVTNSASFSSDDVLWEVNDKIEGDVGNRIGYALGKPLIVPVRGAGGRPVWKAIFGGGYGNRLNEATETLGTVTLFVVDMETGEVEYIDAKDTTVNAANGLGNVVAIDRYTYDSTGKGYITGSDGMVDTVYGGDLQGNVWKFDLTAAGTKRVAFNGKPLFTAKDGTAETSARQAITGGFEAALGPRGGVMLLFGTGSFSFNGDKENKLVQTMYGVLDVPGDTSQPLTRANLQAQTMNADGVIISTTVNYYEQRGWYLNLGVTTGGTFTGVGERVVGYPKIEGGILYFTSYAPTAIDDCSGGGSNYLYGLSTLSGGGALGIVKVGDPNGTSLGEGKGRLGLTTDGSAPVKDVSVFTTGKQGGLTGNPDDAAITKYNELDPEYCMAIVSVAGGQPLYRVRPCGRQSWRQIR